MATFGKTDIGASSAYWSADITYAIRYQLTEDGIVTKISVYVDKEPPVGTIRAAIYNESGGLPNNIVVGATDAQAVVFGWNHFTGLNVALSAGYYWIAAYFSASLSDAKRYDAGETGQEKQRTLEMPDPYGTPDYSFDNAVSIYATYTPSVEEIQEHYCDDVDYR